MGTWSVKIYGSDTACDVKGAYIDRLKRGRTNEEATEELIKRYQQTINDDDEYAVEFWFPLADVQWDYGRLHPKVKEKALEYLDSEGHLELWREEGGKSIMKGLRFLRS